MKKPSWYIAAIAVFIAEVAVTWANQQHEMDKTLGLPPEKKHRKPIQHSNYIKLLVVAITNYFFLAIR